MTLIRKFVTPEEASKAIQKNFKAIPVGVEVISTDEAYGRVLAEDIVSMLDVPPFDRSKVDGYAVKSSDTFKADELKPVTLKILGHVSAGAVSHLRARQGCNVEIATGAPLPKGADAVVALENAHRENDKVKIFHSVAPSENVLKKGFDIKIGEPVLKKFQQITVRELGVMAATGLTKVKVFKQPRVAVISTGNELTEPGRPLPQAKIYDINMRTLTASISECGCIPVIFGIIKDNSTEIKRSLEKALTTTDFVVTSGATSAGVEDVFPKILSELGKPGVIVEGLSTKPGKPTTIAVLNGKLVVALPGHPSAALIIFDLLVRPILREMVGLTTETHGFTAPALAATRIFPAKGRRTYAPVRLVKDPTGELVAYPIPVESGAITTLAKADGFIEIPETREFIEKGEKVEVRLLGQKPPNRIHVFA